MRLCSAQVLIEATDGTKQVYGNGKKHGEEALQNMPILMELVTLMDSGTRWAGF